MGTGCGGSGCDLTDNNTVTQAIGKIGNGAQFTAANSEYLSHIDHADLSTGDIDFSISAWVYLDSKVQGVIAGKFLSAGDKREWDIQYNQPSDRFAAFASSNGITGTSLYANTFGSPAIATWYLISFWHDSVANTINISVNNGGIDSVAHTTGILDGSAPFTLGALSNPLQYWNGRIDGVGFWKRVLTSGERTALYNSGNGDEYPFTVEIPGADIIAPTVTAFTIPATASSLSVSITTFTASDAVGVTGYKLTESPTAPGAGDAGWTGSAPTSYTFSSTGTKTLYAWAKDAASNVSTSLSDSVEVTLPISISNRMLAKPTNNSVTILVKTNMSSDVTVDYGLTTGYGSTATSTNATIHEVSISSLSPSTTYHYKVTASENSNPSNTTATTDSTFKTQLATGNDFNFVIINDMQSGNFSDSVSQILSINPDIILTAGDNIGGENASTVSEFQGRWKVDVFDYIQNLTNHIPLFVTLGNHDAAITNYTNGISAFEQELSMPTSVSGGEKYYSFDYGDAHFVILNGSYAGSNSGTIDSTQLTWLQNDLQSTSKKWKFVFCHFMVYGADDVGYLSTWRLSNYSDVATVLKNNGVLAYFNGHRHVYNRYVKDGVFYITNPNTSNVLIDGAMGTTPYANSGGDAGTIVNADDYNGFTKVSVSPSRASVVIYQRDGTIIDSFDLTPANFELSTPSNNGYTNDSTPTLSWNVSSDNASGLSKYQLYIDGALAQDSISSSATNIDAPSTLSDGAHTWYLKAVNNAGWNTQSTSTYTINVDTATPTGGSISINNGDSYTISRSATLTISASSASQMMVSENSDFSGASWETFSTSKSYTISTGDGTKTIYIKFKDEANNESSSYSDSITYDVTAPASFDLDSPGDNSYTNSERPTFKWKATTDATAGLSKYVLEIDNPSIGSGQPSGDFTIDSIPTSRTTDYETNKYIIHYENFNDSDSTNNYISVYTKSHNDWGSSENDGKLREGRVSWKVKVVDNAGNERTSSRTLFVDRTSPSVSFTQINSTSYTTNNFLTTDKTPTIFGKITDSLSGGDSSQTQDENGPKVASAPKEVNIKVEKKEGLTYKLVTLYKINMDNPYYTCDAGKAIDNSKQKCDKYLPFEYTPKENLDLGTYKITLSGKDKADNTSSESSLTLNVITLAQITTPEEKEIIEKEIKELPKEEQEKVKQELEIIKPTEKAKPNILEKTGEGIAQTGKNIIQGAGNLITMVFTGIGNGVKYVFNGIGSGLAFVGNNIGKSYNTLANNAPGFTKNFLVTIGTNIDNAIKGTRNGIANIAFAIGEKTDDVSHGIGTAIIKIGYLFVPEPTKISNVNAVVLSPTSVKITWTTNHPANGKVNWGYDDGIYKFEDQTDKRTSQHEFILTNLKSGTEYHYEVMSQNRNYVYDANRKFKTPAK